MDFEFTRLGMKDGPISVEFNPITSNILTMGPADTYNPFFPGVSILDSVSYALSPSILPGDEIKYLMSVWNGHYFKKDTITKIYGPIEVVFSEDGGLDPSKWVSTGNWSSTTEDFYSGPECITDSPNADMSSSTQELISVNIDLTEASHAVLRFQTKWDIASRYDFVHVSAAHSDDLVFNPLCGKYTKVGSDYQDAGSQVYDGFMRTWVQEEMILDDYVGEEVTLRILANAISGNAFDGFYFDDLEVWAINGQDLFQPIAVDDSETSIDNEEILILALANDNLQGNIDTTLSIISAPLYGMATVNSDFSINYQPNLDNVSITDSIVYEVCNASTLCDQATVHIDISFTSGLNSHISNNSIYTVYPNPVEDHCIIEFIGNSGSELANELRLFSADGKEVLNRDISSSALDSKLVLDLMNLDSGLYILVMYNSEGPTYNQKLMKY